MLRVDHAVLGGFADFVCQDYAEDTAETVVAWRRFAELFIYDEADQTFSLAAA